jgi:hypothetical protein
MVDDVMHPREGDERLSGSSSNDPRGAGGRDKPRSRQAGRKGAGKSDPARVKAANDVGRALRSVYDSTLREEVPQDFLDLLGKLD